MSQFVFFWGGIYSQWYKSDFTIDGQTYCTAEQYMMAEKARLFGDEVTRAKILKTRNAKEQKKLGREVQGFDEAIWKREAKIIVKRGNRGKFTQDQDLLENLLSNYGKIFVEASPYDTIWGIGLTEDDPRAQDPATWQGTNWLGEVLTELCQELYEERNQ